MKCKSDPNGHHNLMVKLARSEFAILQQLEQLMQQVQKIKEEVMDLRQAAREMNKAGLDLTPNKP